MRVSQLREREDLDGILAATLSDAWSTQLGHKIFVHRSSTGRGEQSWLVQPLLSFYYTKGLSSEARRFVANSFRYTARSRRAPAQWLLGTAISSSLAMGLLGQRGFEASEEIPDAAQLLVLPGNLRVRIFDFKRQVCRVVAKSGFGTRSIEREVELRGEETHSCMIKVSESGANWFEEPLIQGYCLTRLPPWLRRREKEEAAFRLLRSWLEQSSQQFSIDVYLSECRTAVSEDCLWLRDHRDYDVVDLCKEWVSQLSVAASRIKGFATVQSHGDFQPGNIMIDQLGIPILIDWEFSERRSSFYDCLVYDLDSRHGAGLADRVLQFLAGKVGRATRILAASSRSAIWRQAASAVFLIEELRWSLAENKLGPYKHVLPGLQVLGSELTKLENGRRLQV